MLVVILTETPMTDALICMLAALDPSTRERVGAFVADVQTRAAANGVAIVLGGEAKLPYILAPDMLVSGYFVDRPRVELAVAMGKPLAEWLSILVHESCHMDQFIEKSPAWAEAFCEGRETLDWVNDWTDGKDDLPLPIAELLRRSGAVELDCEKRTLARMVEFDLPIDRARYARGANAYVFFYEYLLQTRKWYPGARPPYEVAGIVAAASPTLGSGLTPALIAAYQKYYPEIHRT